MIKLSFDSIRLQSNSNRKSCTLHFRLQIKRPPPPLPSSSSFLLLPPSSSCSVIGSSGADLIGGWLPLPPLAINFNQIHPDNDDRDESMAMLADHLRPESSRISPPLPLFPQLQRCNVATSTWNQSINFQNNNNNNNLTGIPTHKLH